MFTNISYRNGILTTRCYLPYSNLKCKWIIALKKLDLSKQPIRQLKLTHKYLTQPNDTQFSILMQNVSFVQSFLKNLNGNGIINIFHGSSLVFKNAVALKQKIFQLKLANVVKMKLFFYGLILS